MALIRVALTLDDAPCITERGVASDPSHMDAIRVTLKEHGVRHCVAFVIGGTARGHEAALRRWIDDGYELGNHTYDHPRASRVSVSHFVKSMQQCHELLLSVGAFDAERTAWFRFPFLSRGSDAGARSEIQRECEALGYRIAHASVDFYDNYFEQRFSEAAREGRSGETTAIGSRYEEVAFESVQFAAARVLETQGRAAPLVPYCHFGLLSRQHLGGILRKLDAAGIELCSLVEAMRDPIYAHFDTDPSRDGLVLHTLPKSPVTRVTSGLARLSEFVGVADQARFGPRWPYLR